VVGQIREFCKSHDSREKLTALVLITQGYRQCHHLIQCIWLLFTVH